MAAVASQGNFACGSATGRGGRHPHSTSPVGLCQVRMMCQVCATLTVAQVALPRPQPALLKGAVLLVHPTM